MRTAIVTGSGGLIGSESVRFFAEAGYRVIGIENDMRAYYFGPAASTGHVTRELEASVADFESVQTDVRDRDGVERLFANHAREIELIIHAAAQPSHDWAAREPHTDFAVNAVGTLNLLEAARVHTPDVPFVFTSTNKVYGDRPNELPLLELETRWELADNHPWYNGIPSHMSIDRCTHSVFGASKVAADVMVQEYGRYFGMPTVCFRGGCLTGPQHAGAQLHGFLAYLMKCTVTGSAYQVFGYNAKQVRDNIHAGDVVRAFDAFANAPKPAAVYNLGGGRESNVSMLEAIAKCERIAERALEYTVSAEPRVGDHQWYISDLREFKDDYPGWSLTHSIDDVLTEIYEDNAERWSELSAPVERSVSAAHLEP